MTVTNLDDLRNRWPDNEVGLRCRDLLLAYLTEKLVVTAGNNDCNPVSSAGEAAADKVFANLIADVRTLGTTRPPVAAPTSKPLHRFSPSRTNETPAAQ